MAILAILKVHLGTKIIKYEGISSKPSHYEETTILETDLAASKEPIAHFETFLKTDTTLIGIKNACYTGREKLYFSQKNFNRHYHLKTIKACAEETEESKSSSLKFDDDSFYIIIRNDIGSEKENKKAFSRIHEIVTINTLPERDSRSNIESALRTYITQQNEKEKKQEALLARQIYRRKTDNRFSFLCCGCDDDEDEEKNNNSYRRLT